MQFEMRPVSVAVVSMEQSPYMYKQKHLWLHVVLLLNNVWYVSLCTVLSVYMYMGLLYGFLLSLQWGRTPLIKASAGGHVGCVQLLLDRGAQANLQDKVSAV